jgi:voltage-gated potassium channel Kch
VSEFSLILISLGFSFGQINREVVSLITLVAIITIIGSTYLMLYSDQLYTRFKYLLKFIEFRKKSKVEKVDIPEVKDIIIFGYDRIGYDFVNISQKINRNYFVVDFDPSAMGKLDRNHIPHKFGDALDVDFLEEIGFYEAKTIISTIPDFKTNLHLVHYYRNHNKGGIIIVISHNIKDARELYKQGASFVVMPHYLGANFASKMIEKYGIESTAFEKEKMHHLEYLQKRQGLTEER